MPNTPPFFFIDVTRCYLLPFLSASLREHPIGLFKSNFGPLFFTITGFLHVQCLLCGIVGLFHSFIFSCLFSCCNASFTLFSKWRVVTVHQVHWVLVHMIVQSFVPLGSVSRLELIPPDLLFSATALLLSRFFCCCAVPFLPCFAT